MPEILVQRPQGEPIDIAEALMHMRITESSQNPIVAGLLSSARVACEVKTRQQLLHARYQLTLDKFPMSGVGTPLPFRDQVNIPPYSIILPHAPFADLISIKYLDMNASLQTVPQTLYTVNSTLMPAIVTPVFGQIWPIPLPQVGSVMLTYDAGYASPISVSGSTVTVTGPVTFKVGSVVRFYNSGGALPALLSEETDYLIATMTPGAIPNLNSYTLTDPSGGDITLTDTGSGSNYIAFSNIGVVPEGLRAWILMRTGSIYENREEVAILNRGKVEELPFVDGLLDPYRLSLP